jgi:membrane associated rhomboid family serine protease
MAQESFFDGVKSGIMRMPAGLRWIVLSTVGVFILQALIAVVLGAEAARWVNQTFGILQNVGVTLTEPWRMVTYMLLHAGGFHILFNLLWLWWMGQAVENTLGTRNFLMIYIGSGIGGALVNALVALAFGSATALPTIGASGAVFGVMVAFAMLYPTAPIMLLLLPPIQARYVVAGLIALDILFLTANDNVARVVHLGGAASGWVLMRYYSTGGMDRLASLFSKWKSARGPKNKRMRSVVDATIIEEIDQSEIDRILDKIAQKGYSSLSAEEKKRLFDSSKR